MTYDALSERDFELPPDRPVTFAVDLAVESMRRGMAAFRIFDLAASTRVFAVCGMSTRVLALHEDVGSEPFYSMVESPCRPRACEITLDRSTSTAAWRVDGHLVHEAHGTVIPERVRIGFGVWTMLKARRGGDGSTGA